MTCLRATCFLLVFATLPCRAQTAIDYTDGENDTSDYNTSSPLDPTTLSITSGSATQSGALFGSGAVIKTGAGTLTLTGTNTYTGGTTIAGGTLVIDASSRLSTGVVRIATGGILSGDSASLSFANRNVIVDGGGSTLTTGGSLQMVNSSIFVSAGGTVTAGTSIELGVADTFNGILTGAGSSLTAGTGLYLGAAGGNGALGVGFGCTVTAASVTLGTAGGTGTFNLQAGGTLAIGGMEPIVVNGGAFGIASGTLRMTSDFQTSAPMLFANGVTLDTNGFAARFNTSIAGSVTLTKIGAGTLTLTAANTYGNGTVVSGGLVEFSTADNFGSGNVTLDGGGLQWASGSTTDISPRLNAIGAGGATFNTNGNDVTLGTVLSGGGGFTKTGAGKLTLTTANTYTGGTTLAAGAITFSTGSLGSGGITLNGGTSLQWASGNTDDVSAQLQPLGAGGVTFDTNGNDVTLASPISGVGGYTKTGAGILTLSGVNTYTGGTTVSEGAIAIGSAANLGAPALLTIKTGAAVTGGSSDLAFDRDIDVDGSCSSLATTGSLEFSGASTIAITNGAAVSAGATVTFGAISGSAGNVTGAGSTLTADGVLYVAAQGGVGILSVGSGGVVTASSVTFGSMGGTGTFNLEAGGTLQTGSVSGTGTFNFSGGTLESTGNGAFGSLAGTSNVTKASTIDTSGHNLMMNDALDGAGSITKIGAGTLTLANANTYTGGTTVSGGLIRFSAASNFGTGSITLDGGGLKWGGGASTDISPRLNPLGAGGATFDTNGNDVTLGTALSGGGLAKSGVGMLTLTAANTYTGATTISAGILQVGDGASLGTGDVTDNAALVFAGNATYAGSIAGIGSLTKTGAGTLTLSHANTYSGGTTISAGTVAFASGALGGGGILVNGAGLQWSTGNTDDISPQLGPIGAGGATFDTNGNNVAFASSFSGIGGITKTGAGTMTLSGANTFAGSIVLGAGELSVSADANLGDGANQLVFSGGTLQVTGTALTSIGTRTYNNSTFNGGFDIAGAANTFTVPDAFSGTGSLTKSGAGNLVLTAKNTYSGGTTVSAGTLTLDGTDAAAGIIAGNVTIRSGATLFAESGNAFGYGASKVDNVTIESGGSLTAPATSTNLGWGVNYTLNGATMSSNGGVTSTTSAAKFSFGDFTTVTAGGSTQSTIAGHVDLRSDVNPTTPFTVNAPASLLVTAGISTNSDGGVAGIAGLSKLGDGLMILTASNTYTGGTTVSGGLIRFSAANNFGTANITLDGGGLQWATGSTVDISPKLNAIGAGGGTFDTNGNNVTFGTAISGGGLTKSGLGTLTLTTTNTYTGGTTVSGGTLAITDPAMLGSGPVSVVTGGFLDGGSSNLIFDRDVSVTDNFSSIRTNGYIEIGHSLSGSLSIANGGRVNTNATLAFGLNGTGTGSVTGVSSSLSVRNGLYLGGSGGTGTLDVSSGGTVSAARVIFGQGGGSGTLNVNSGGTLQVGGTDGIAVDTGTAAFNLAGGTLGVSGSNFTTSVPLTLTGASTIDTSFRDATLSGALGGSGGFTKTGSGTLTLGVTNTYTGVTTIASGTLALGPGVSFTAVTPRVVVGSPGFSGAFVIGSGASLLAGGADPVYAAPSSFLPTLNLAGGTIKVTGSDLTLSIPMTLSGASLIDTNGMDATFSGTLGGSGGFTKAGAGTLFLTQANTYSGGTTLSAGTISIGDASGIGIGRVSINGGTLHSAGTFSLDNAVTIDGAGSSLTTDGYVESGVGSIGSITITNSGTLNSASSVAFGVFGNGTGSVTGPNSTLTAATTLHIGYASTGTLSVGSGGTVTAGTLALGASGGAGTFNLNTGGTLRIGGANGIQAAGASQVNLAGGTLEVTGSGLTTGAQMTLSNTSSVDTNGLDATFSGILSGSGGLTKTGTGTLFLTRANSYTGGTTVSEGSVSLTNTSGSGVGTGSVTISGGTLHATASFILDNTLTIDGAGSSLGSDNGVASGISDGSTGSITITNGGTLDAATSVSLGALGTGTGSVTGTDSRLTAAFQVSVGDTSSLSVGSGGTVAAGWVSLGSGTLNLNAGGTLQVGDTLGFPLDGISGSNTVHFNWSGGKLVVANHNLRTSVPMVLSNDSLIDTGGFNAALSGKLSGTGSLTKTGAGALTLSGSNTYSGGTTISAGTLNVNGSRTGSGPVFIAAGATLAGSFTIPGATQMNGLLSPGDSAIGAAKFGGDLTFGSTATTAIQLASASSFDTINVVGTLTLDGTIAVVTIGGYVVPEGASFQIIGWSVLVATGFNPASDFDFSGATLAPNVSWNTSQFLATGTLVAIPEPTEWGTLLVAALAGLALLRRRRQAKAP